MDLVRSASSHKSELGSTCSSPVKLSAVCSPSWQLHLSGKTLSQNHPLKPPANSWPEKTETASISYFRFRYSTQQQITNERPFERVVGVYHVFLAHDLPGWGTHLNARWKQNRIWGNVMLNQTPLLYLHPRQHTRLEKLLWVETSILFIWKIRILNDCNQRDPKVRLSKKELGGKQHKLDINVYLIFLKWF